jgi:hypothetical protein
MRPGSVAPQLDSANAVMFGRSPFEQETRQRPGQSSTLTASPAHHEIGLPLPAFADESPRRLLNKMKVGD